MRIILRRILQNENTGVAFLGLKRVQFGRLGVNVRFGKPFSTFSSAKNIHIGDNVFIGRESYFEGVSRIEIGSGTMIGPRVFCFAGSHNYSSGDLRSVPYDNRNVDVPITIGENVWIAGNVSIAPGTTIGEGSVVGLGSVVAGNIPPYSVVVGPKATPIKTRNIEQYKNLVEAGAIYNLVFAEKGFEMMSDSAAPEENQE